MILCVCVCVLHKSLSPAFLEVSRLGIQGALHPGMDTAGAGVAAAGAGVVAAGSSFAGAAVARATWHSTNIWRCLG